MTLTISTNAYATAAFVASYLLERGEADFDALSEAAQEPFIIKATDYVERNFNWRGDRLTAAQRLHWPASNAYDDSGYSIGATDVPWQVQEAVAIVADLYRAGTYDLTGILTDDLAALKRTKVDVIEQEFDTARRLNGADVLSHVIQLLRPVTLDGGLKRS